MEYFSVLEGTSSESIRRASQMIASVLEEVDIQCTASILDRWLACVTLVSESLDMLIYLLYNNMENRNALCLVFNMNFTDLFLSILSSITYRSLMLC